MVLREEKGLLLASFHGPRGAEGHLLASFHGPQGPGRLEWTLLPLF